MRRRQIYAEKLNHEVNKIQPEVVTSSQVKPTTAKISSRFVCEYCELQFPTERGLKVHKGRVHSEQLRHDDRSGAGGRG